MPLTFTDLYALVRPVTPVDSSGFRQGLAGARAGMAGVRESDQLTEIERRNLELEQMARRTQDEVERAAAAQEAFDREKEEARVAEWLRGQQLDEATERYKVYKDAQGLPLSQQQAALDTGWGILGGERMGPTEAEMVDSLQIGAGMDSGMAMGSGPPDPEARHAAAHRSAGVINEQLPEGQKFRGGKWVPDTDKTPEVLADEQKFGIDSWLKPGMTGIMPEDVLDYGTEHIQRVMEGEVYRDEPGTWEEMETTVQPEYEGLAVWPNTMFGDLDVHRLERGAPGPVTKKDKVWVPGSRTKIDAEPWGTPKSEAALDEDIARLAGEGPDLEQGELMGVPPPDFRPGYKFRTGEEVRGPDIQEQDRLAREEGETMWAAITEGAPEKEKKFFEIGKKAYDSIAQTHGYVKANEFLMNDIINPMAGRQASMDRAGLAARASASRTDRSGQRQDANDARREMERDAKVMGAPGTLESFQDFGKAISALRANPTNPNTWAAVIRAFGRAAGEQRMTDADARDLAGVDRASFLDRLEQLATQAVRGGVSEPILHNTLESLDSFQVLFSDRALAQYKSLLDQHRNYLPGGAMENPIAAKKTEMYIRSVFGAYEWSKPAFKRDFKPRGKVPSAGAGSGSGEGVKVEVTGESASEAAQRAAELLDRLEGKKK